MCLYSCNKLTWAKWLCHIVIGTKTKTSYLINIILLCRNHYNRCILVLTNLLADIKSINSWKHQI